MQDNRTEQEMSLAQIFREQWKKGLGEYLMALDNAHSNGFFRNNPHPYIIRCSEDTRIEFIKKDNILPGVDKEHFESLISKPHIYAHHLNSSQMMCYNFFRPKMTVDSSAPCKGYANAEMVRFVKSLGITISESAVCQFEYEDRRMRDRFRSFISKGKGEKSQFDFHIEDGPVQIFFEIKYTETSFGGWSRTKRTSDEALDNHCRYIEQGYKKLVRENPYLTESCKDEICSLPYGSLADPNVIVNKQYQLFRNALKAENENCYSVFIYPEANPGPKNEFREFSRNLAGGQRHVMAITWESLTDYMTDEFRKKYIDIL